MGKDSGSKREKTWTGRGAVKSLVLIPLVVSRVNSSNVIKLNSEPEKCYPTKSTIPLAI